MQNGFVLDFEMFKSLCRSTDWDHWAICVANDWQTLIASLIAFLAAILTIIMIRKQIKLQQIQINFERQNHRIARQRKEQATRAGLPIALSAICEYSTECAWQWLEDAPNRRGLNSPSQAIGVIIDAIEFMDERVSGQLSELSAFFQIHNARLRGGGSRTAPHDISQGIYDAAQLYCLKRVAFILPRIQRL